MPLEKKPKKPSLLRWKYAAPALIIVALLVAFNLLFLDHLLKLGLVSAGQLMFGAKVEVGSLKTSIPRLSLDIADLRIADQNAPMTNLAEAGRIAFGVELIPLLSKKLVIPAMRLEGLRWGTARRTSGALPPRKAKRIRQQQGEGPVDKLIGRLGDKAKAETSALPSIESLQNARAQLSSLSLDKVVEVKNLESLKAMEQLKAEYQDKAASYQKELRSLDVKTKLDAAAPAFQALSGLKVDSLEAAAAAKGKLDAARAKVQELQSALDQLKSLQARAQRDLGQTQDVTRRLAELKDRDLKALSAKFSLPSLGSAGLTQALVGPVWLNRVQTALRLIATARRYLPPRKPEQAAVTRPRLRGQDVSFPRENVPPDLLVRTISLTGSTGGAGKSGEALDFSGTVTDLTSDPAGLGRPTRVELAGTQGPRQLRLEAVLDHTREVPRDAFTAEVKGLNAGDLKLPEGDFFPDIRSGRLSSLMRLELKGDDLDTTLEVRLAGLKPPASAGGDAARWTQELWRGIDALRITARLAAVGEDLKLDLSSDLDAQLSKRFQDLLGSKTAEYQQKLKAEIDRLTAGQESEVLKQVGVSQSTVLGPISDQQKALTDRIGSAQNLLKGQAAPATGIADEKKRAAEDAVKQKAQDQLQNLFNR